MSTDNTNQSNSKKQDIEVSTIETSHIKNLDIENLEKQARQITGLLDDHAKRLSMRTMKQLEDGRAHAVKMHAQHANATVNADGTLNHLSAWLGGHRGIAASMILVLVASSVLVLSNMQQQESSDAFILGADLPPEAFVDRGFEPSLNKHKKYL